MTATELNPLIQVTDPYTPLTYGDIDLSSESESIRFEDRPCPSCEEYRRFVCCEPLEEEIHRSIGLNIAHFEIGSSPLLVFGGGLTGAFSTSVKCSAIFTGVFGLGGILCLIGGVGTFCYYQYTASTKHLRDRLEHYVQEAEGDLGSRVSDYAIVEFFRRLNRNHYIKLDFNHTVAIYREDDLRPLFIEIVENLTPSLKEIWEQAIAVHALSAEHFREVWGNSYFQSTLRQNPQLQQSILDFLPGELKAITEEIHVEERDPSTFAISLPEVSVPSSRAASSSPTSTPRVKLILNGITTIFDPNVLVKCSPFFKEKFKEIDFSFTERLGAEPLFVNLALNSDQEEHLGRLLGILNSKQVPLSLSEISILYSAARDYGLEPLLRSTYIQVLTWNDLHSLLLHTDDLAWHELKAELIVKLSLFLSQPNSANYDYVHDAYHFRELHAYAENTGLTTIKEAFCENFITAFKNQIEHYKNFDLIKNRHSASLFECFASLEILIPYFSDLENHSLQQELQLKVNEDAETPIKLRRLYEGYRSVRSESMLKRTVGNALRGSEASSVLEQAYTLIDPMPDELSQFLKQQKKLL